MYRTHRDLFALATTQRLLQGVAIGCVLTRLPIYRRSAGSAAFPLDDLVLAMAVCGMAIGVAVDRWLRTAVPIRVAAGVNLVAIAGGLQMLAHWSPPSPGYAAVLLIGFATSSGWSSTSELARQSLSNRRRWRGMMIWTTSFAAGLSLSLLGGFTPWVPVLGMTHVMPGLPFLGSFVAMMLIPTSFVVPQPKGTDVDRHSAFGSDRLPEPTPSDSQDAVTQHTGTASHAGADPAAECDATDCCGGESRKFTPPKFRHGVLLSAAGFATLVGPLAWLWVETMLAYNGLVTLAVAGGLIAGYALVLQAAPRAGYAVTLLPFFAGALLLAIVNAAFTIAPVAQPLLFGLQAIISSGIVCGMSALIGELFPDCATDPQRTRIITVSLFATTLFLLARMLLVVVTDSAAVQWIINASVFVVGILAIRSIPAPVISTLGKEADSDDDDEELNDVLASLNA